MANHEATHPTQKANTPAPKKPASSVQPAFSQSHSLAPVLESPAGAITLQRTVGNRRTQRLIQARLTVGAAHDPLEREADRVADQVVSRSSIQRHADEDEVMAKRTDVAISRAPQEEEELLTKRGGMMDSFDAGGDFERRLGSSGSGAPLDKNTRSRMEAGIGADFGNVRVHTGDHASSLNRSISARAFTRGSDVFFDHGQYNPGSVAGQRLLAHELTHVVQQGAASQSNVQRWPWSKKKKVTTTTPENDETTPKSEEGTEAITTPNTAPETTDQTDTLSIDPDYSNKDVKDQAPTRFKFTVLVWMQNKNYLYMQKVRAMTTVRNTLRKAARSIGLGKLGVRKPKTSSEMKTKTARKVAELNPAYGNMGEEDKLKEIQKIEGQTREMGHTWSRLTAYSGEAIKDIYSFGFWPAQGIDRPDEATEGEVMQPDHVHDSDAPLRVMHYDIPATSYNAALKWADGQVQNPPQYKMIGLNCTSWSKMLAGKAGVSFPSSGNVFPAEPSQGFFQRIFSPNKLYDDMSKDDNSKESIDAVPSSISSFMINFNTQAEVGGGTLELPMGKTLTLRSMGGDDVAELDDGTRLTIDDDNYPNVDDWQNVMVKVHDGNKYGVLYASELKAYYKENGANDQSSEEQYDLPEPKSVHKLTGDLSVKTSRGRRTISAGMNVMVTEVNDEDDIGIDSERDRQTGDSIRGTTTAKEFHLATTG